MESAGARLKKLRLEKGLSLEEASKKTKVHLNILKALEEDNIINLSPVYIKGFLKIYCKFLGVDAKDYLTGYQESQDKTIKLPEVKENPRPAAFIFIIGLIILSFLLFGLGKSISKFTQRAKKPKAIVKQQNIQSNVQGSAKVEKYTGQGIRLGIRARGDCWVELKVDGQLLFKNILKKGRTESWQAKEKFELSLGNAQAVDLEVNGKLISGLGRKGQSVKNILISKEGLSIPR